MCRSCTYKSVQPKCLDRKVTNCNFLDGIYILVTVEERSKLICFNEFISAISFDLFDHRNHQLRNDVQTFYYSLRCTFNKKIKEK